MLPVLPHTFRTVTIPDGEAGILAAVREIARFIREQASQPLVRAYAITATAGCGTMDQACRAQKILVWVRDHLRFVPDTRSVETIGGPAFHLRAIRITGESSGDCDDAAALTGALARAVGLRVRIVTASFLPDRRLHHVWTEALGNGRWIELDPFRSERFGGTPTRLQITEV